MDEVKSLGDLDSAVVVGPDNEFTVTIQSKELVHGPLERINYTEYVRRMKEKENRLYKTIRELNLEVDLEDAKIEAKKAQCEKKKEVDKILEG